MSQTQAPQNWTKFMAGVANKSKKIQNYRINKEIKNTSSYEPISIDYTKLYSKENNSNEELKNKQDYLQSLFNRMYNTIQNYDDGSFYTALYDASKQVMYIKKQGMNIKDSADKTYSADDIYFQTVTDISSLEVAGIFSFTYYKPTISFSSPTVIKTEQYRDSNISVVIRNYLSPDTLERNIKRIYLQGILKYLELTTEPVFKNWKVAVYTDKYTINYFKNIHQQIINDEVKNADDVLEYYHWLKLYSHPNAIIMCVTMPSYSMNNARGTMNNADKIIEDPCGTNKNPCEIVEYSVIRMMRFHAFQLFPAIPVFVRDADTLFTRKPTYLLSKADIYRDDMSEADKSFLYNWEATFYENFRGKNRDLPFCIGVNDLYKKPWHFDPHGNKESLGIFAGFVSSLGGIVEWANGTLWASCIDYIKSHVAMINITNDLKKISRLDVKNKKTKKITDNASKAYHVNDFTYETYIGKDEQILIFAVLPQLLSKTYFYYLDVIRVSDSLFGMATFRKNSPLAKETNSIRPLFTKFIEKNIRDKIINGKLKVYFQNKEISSGELEIQKIINIFNAPEIHDRLKTLFTRIISGWGKGTKQSSENGNNGPQKKSTGGRRTRKQKKIRKH